MTTSHRRFFWAIVLLLWPGLPLAQTQDVGQATDESARLKPGTPDDSTAKRMPVNAGFEVGTVGDRPTGWFVPEIPSYQVTTSDEQPAEGHHCATMVCATEPEPPHFGNLMQKIDAQPFRGKRVRLRAAVRAAVDGTGNQAQMWFRVDRPPEDGTPQMGVFDNMGDRPITSATWNHYEIVGDVDDDAEHIALGVMLLGQGQAWVDDVSLEFVGDDIPVTAKPLPDSGRSGTPLDEVKPGLFEIISSMRLTPNNNPLTSHRGFMNTLSGEPIPPQTVLLPLPLSYRDQVPIGFRLTVDPPDAVQAIDIYEDRPNNYVLKLIVDDVVKWKQVDVTFRSTILVGASAFDAVPASAPVPVTWPDEAKPWLAASWCADAKHERIQSLAAEIRAETSDVPEIIRRVEKTADKLYRSANGHVQNLTAVEALDKQGSCTSCANLVAALLRASGVPARVLSGYPVWSGPLQTHYLVEAYVPDYGWYPIESTLCRSPWPNKHQVNVAIIPPEYEQEPKARCTKHGGGRRALPVAHGDA